jgi:competence protein ComEA
MTTNARSRPLSDRTGDRRRERHQGIARLDVLHERVAARFGVAPRAVLGAVLVAMAVIGVLGVRLLLASEGERLLPVAPRAVGTPSTGTPSMGPQAVPVSRAASSRSPSSGQSGPRAGQPRADPTAAVTRQGQLTGQPLNADTGQVLVHVVGRVRHPGVVSLPAGARVQQAINAAGGARRDADLARVNLARPVMDGEQVVVPRPGEPAGPIADPVGGAQAGSPRPGTSGASSASGRNGTAPGQPVDINTATFAELDTLPGVGPVLAQRILDWRAQNGRFTSVEELGEVSGIGDAVLARLRPLVRL